MIDTLMALWNRGYSGRGVIVAVAFFVICISISLLLITVQGPWAAQVNRPRGTLSQRGPAGTTSAIATRQTSGVQPIADNTVTIYAPTATTAPSPTSTAVSCVTSQAAGQTPARPSSTPTPVIDHQTPIPTRPRPTPTPTHTPPTATPQPTIPATATSTPPPTPTATSTPTPTPSPTPSPTATPSPTVIPTVTPTAVPSATVTAVSSPTSPIIPLAAKRTLCAQNEIGDNVGTSGYGPGGAIIARTLGLILSGSALGTALFYLSMYWLARRKRG